MSILRVTLYNPIEGNESPEEMVSEVYIRVAIEGGRIIGQRYDRDGTELICRIDQRWRQETYEVAVKGKVHAYLNIDIQPVG
jgi:hypothetical protein